MYIDEKNKYVLTNYKAATQKGNAIDSDHKTEYMDLDLKIIREKPKTREVFNFRDKKAQERFKSKTSETEEFPKCFENNLPVLKQVDSWRKVLKNYCSKSLKKIRITGRKQSKPINQEIANLINQRRKLLELKQIDCKKCDTKGEGKSQQEEHTSFMHTAHKIFKCLECDKIVVSEKRFKEPKTKSHPS